MFDFFKHRRRNKLRTKSSEILLFKESNFVATEAYKLLRTNINFTLPDEGKCRVIGVTSAVRGEGKSTTAVNLAYVLSEAGKRVLLVDSDLRLPSIAKKLGIQSSPGLSDMLIRPTHDTEAILQMEKYESWFVLPAGSIPPNPSEMLGSMQMERYLSSLMGDYDFIIIDLPPVTVVSDALAIAPSLDGMIVVVRSDYSERRELNKCIRSLELSKVKILGIVMNAKREGGAGYSRYRYKKKSYYKHSYAPQESVENDGAVKEND
ncbi:MAG: CpsD/CapB family tyrosine-protein kinase [Clostridia bacterium]|nr:CpsD/CapB family tyrosine-protein kinase [Clostridia bacterium]